MHGFFFSPPKQQQSSHLSYLQLWCPGEDFLRGAAFGTWSVLQCVFAWRQLKSFFLWIFAEGPGSDGLVRIHTHWDQVLQSCKVGYVLLSPHLHHLYMYFLNSFHFHKFLLTNIWVQPYGRKEYHKHDFFLNSNIAVTLPQNGKRKKILFLLIRWLNQCLQGILGSELSAMSCTKPTSTSLITLSLHLCGNELKFCPY